MSAAPVNPLTRYAHLALIGQGRPLLHLAQDGALPGAAPDERRLGLVARVLVDRTNAVVYSADAPVSDVCIDDLHRAVAELAEALGVEMPLTLEGATTLANAGSVNIGNATVLTRLLTHYPSAPEWDADLDELYAWSQA